MGGCLWLKGKPQRDRGRDSQPRPRPQLNSQRPPDAWTLIVLRPERPFTGVSGPSGPKIPKKSQKSLPGPPGPECPKSLEKSQKVSEKSLFDTFLRLFDSFRDFLDTPGPEARGDFSETFWGFWARSARRLL